MLKTHKITFENVDVFIGTKQECMKSLDETHSFSYAIEELSRLEKAIENDCLELL